jgi:hypothetical protein
LAAQASQTVPPNDPVYGFVDRLVAARLVDAVIVGQRPMSRREIGRVIGAARTRAEAGSWLANRLAEYAQAFPDSVERAPVTSLLEADAIAMDSPTRGIVRDANGAIDVRVNPLAGNQLGRPVAEGQTYAYRAAIGSGITPWLAAAVDERATWLVPRAGSAKHRARIDQLYVRGLWKNASASIGRDYLYLGQGSDAGLLASVNPNSIDQIHLASDQPFMLPWLFRLMGPMQATATLGDLGKDQAFPHTRLFAYKLSARPHPRFEIGAGLSEQVGGEGSPPGTFIEKAIDAFPLIDGLLLHRVTLFSNKFVGVDMRYAVPGLRGLQAYLEGAFDDFDLRRARSVFTEDAGWVWGLSNSCFAECGPIRTSIEYHITGLRYYTHGGYTNGFTVDSAIIGDQLGPRAKAAYGSLDVDRGRYSFGATLAYEDRSGNLYGSVTTTPDDSDFRFIVVERRPAERRWRALASTTLGGINASTAYMMKLGAERVENFGFANGPWRTNWLAQAGVQIRPTAPRF